MTTDHQKLSILLFLQEKIFSEGYDVLGAAREKCDFSFYTPLPWIIRLFSLHDH